MTWQPTYIQFAEEAFKTATETALVTTDAGKGYLKALGNRGGPHYLAADWVATHLARWLGLATFEFAILEVTDLDEVLFANGKRAEPGPAFITREMIGNTWGGGPDSLKNLVNPEDLGKLVVFDTWTRNCDRHPPDLSTRKPNLGNVYLSIEDVPPGKQRLIAMDHTHCFNCGRDLDKNLSRIDLVKDDKIYGLFPEFIPYMADSSLRPAWEASVTQLNTLDRSEVDRIVRSIPDAWQVDPSGKTALTEQICQRASFVSSNFVRLIEPYLNPN
jgi:hypothetical protein